MASARPPGSDNENEQDFIQHRPLLSTPQADTSTRVNRPTDRGDILMVPINEGGEVVNGTHGENEEDEETLPLTTNESIDSGEISWKKMDKTFTSKFSREKVKDNVKEKVCRIVYRPQLIISIFGGSQFSSEYVQDIFRAGILPAARMVGSKSAVVLLDNNKQLIEYIREAVEDLKILSPQPVSVNIFLQLDWPTTGTNIMLKKRRNIEPKYFLEVTDETYAKDNLRLHPVFGHYFFVDRSGGEENPERRPTPIDGIPEVCVLVKGSGIDIAQCHRMIVGEEKPLIVLKGSGGLADILADASEVSVEEKEHSKWVRRKIKEKFSIYSEETVNELYVKISEICSESRTHLMTIYDITEPACSFDQLITEALSKSKCKPGVDLLVCYQSLNNLEEVKTVLKSHNFELPFSELRDIFVDAGKKGNAQFVEYYIKTYPDYLSLWYKELVVQIFKEPHHMEHYNLEIKDVSRLLQTKYGHFKRCMDNHITMIEFDKLSPLQILFIWSLLEMKLELSLVFWRAGQQHLSTSLFAYAVLQSMRQCEKDTRQREKLKETAKEYQELGITTLNQCYLTIPEETIQILTQPIGALSSKTCIELAIYTKNRQFLSQVACQHVQDRVWQWGSKASTLGSKVKSVEPRDMKQWVLYLMSPVVMFSLNFLGLVVVVFLLLFVLNPQLHWLEFVLVPWVICFILEECNQIYRKQEFRKLSAVGLAKEYFRDGWNIIDATAIVLFLLAWSVRYYVAAHPDDLDLSQWMDGARILFSLAYLAFSVRCLEAFYIHRRLGPLIEMILQMIRELLWFLVLLLVFFLAYAVMSEAVLNPQAKLNARTLFNILRKPYWQMFGELFLNELEAQPGDACDELTCSMDPMEYEIYNKVRCLSPSAKLYAPILLGVYLLFTNVLLFNLVIAKFNFSIERVDAIALEIWHLQKFALTDECAHIMFLPPPFTFLSILAWCCRRDQPPSVFRQNYDSESSLKLKQLIHREKIVVSNMKFKK